MSVNDDGGPSGASASRAPAAKASFAAKLQQLFDAVRAPGGQAYEPGDLADALHDAGVPLAERVVDRLRAGIGGPPSDSAVQAIARFFEFDPNFLTDEALDSNSPPLQQAQSTSDRPEGVRVESGWPIPGSTESEPTDIVVPRVYAKARNNDPTVPFNSRKTHFKSGRGFAVDIQVRDYNGSAAQRYEEGVIIGFWESESDARRVADDVNSGRRYGPGHHLHTRAHSAIVIPAWNASDFPGDQLPWETREGSAAMLATYESEDVPIPQWLSTILARFDDMPATAFEAGSRDGASAPVDSNIENASEATFEARLTDEASRTNSVSRATSFDDYVLNMISEAVRVGEIIMTLGTARPNHIVHIGRSGIRVVTEKSEQKGIGPQLVPAWMIMAAWNHLRRHGSLTQTELVNELNVKRSAFICALLTRLPNVEYEAAPHVKLKLARGSTADEGVPVGRPGTDDKSKTVSAQSFSRHADASSRVGDGVRSGAEEEYASRLNRLFDTVHPDDRGPYSNEEAAAALQADGILLHANSISRLREGTGGQPTDSTTYALAFFFNVDPGHLVDGIDFGQVSTVKPSTGQSHPRRAQVPNRVPGEGRRPRQSGRPSGRVGNHLQLSTSDLLRISAGLSQATLYASQQVYADGGLIRRLVSLISEVGPLLLESLSSDVLVPIRYLEHVIVEWDETSPSDNGTASDYRWMAELLNRYLDDD